MHILKFVAHVCARGHVHLCVHVSSESLWVILCVFIFGLQLVLPLWAGVCVCVREREREREREDISVGMHVYLCCFLSRYRIATYLVSQSLRMFWSTLTHMPVPQTLSSGRVNFECLQCLLWLGYLLVLGLKITSLTLLSEYTTVHLYEKWFVWFSSLCSGCSVRCFQREIAHFERARAE